jgi:predicted nucleic acid-binding Zn ribbon protein
MSSTGRDDDMHDERFASAAFRVGADPRDDDFTAVGDALERVRDELGLPAPAALDVLRERWADIVGADIAAHAHLIAVRDGVATVTADGPLWATQLRYLEAAIVAGVEAVVGPGVVAAVRVRVAG